MRVLELPWASFTRRSLQLLAMGKASIAINALIPFPVLLMLHGSPVSLLDTTPTSNPDVLHSKYLTNPQDTVL
jgi:hypothetical protein